LRTHRGAIAALRISWGSTVRRSRSWPPQLPPRIGDLDQGSTHARTPCWLMPGVLHPPAGQRQCGADFRPSSRPLELTTCWLRRRSSITYPSRSCCQTDVCRPKSISLAGPAGKSCCSGRHASDQAVGNQEGRSSACAIAQTISRHWAGSSPIERRTRDETVDLRDCHSWLYNSAAVPNVRMTSPLRGTTKIRSMPMPASRKTLLLAAQTHQAGQ
jgi:hypothetical protein